MVSETRGGFAPTGGVRWESHLERSSAVHSGEAATSSSGDGANSPHGSFDSGPSWYGSSTTRMSSFYNWFGVRKLEMIRRWRRLEGE
jgi:hypothetical protein